MGSNIQAKRLSFAGNSDISSHLESTRGREHKDRARLEGRCSYEAFVLFLCLPGLGGGYRLKPRMSGQELMCLCDSSVPWRINV